jgi:Icc protein
VILAQITDMHIKPRGRVLNHMPHVAQPLRRALLAIAALPARPSFILATGDLTESGTGPEYERLRDILSDSPIPVYLIPGNHDRAAALRAAFPQHSYLGAATGGVLFAVELPSVRIIALDTSSERHSGGYLNRERLAWLERTLAERRSTTTILAMHHPPFMTGIKRFDRQIFEGREALEAIVRRNAQIARVICGHVHQFLRRPWCTTLAVTAPSTAPTLTLDATFGLRWEPGGFLVHRYEPQTEALTTSLIRTDADTTPLSA